ncbi:MAG: oligopeptide transporter, OPT family, partial [Candidatus Aminicenantes bacterium]|nr:oligopeptide transporter, OPT family [Candidatus Aminicenantes bacterium]
MEEFRPHIPDETEYKDFSIRALILGALFGIIFGAANAYIGLRVGLTISTAIPLAVISVAVFKALSPIIGRKTILEANIAQTTGSASSSLASGIIFTIPALFMWGFNPSVIKIGTLAMLGGILGVLFMIPLRRALIVQEHSVLPYPEGTAAASVLIAADTGKGSAANVFIGLIVGLFYKICLVFLHLFPERIYLKIPVLKKAQLGMEPTPALLGVGFILGPRIAAIMVAGGLLSWLGIIPLIALIGGGDPVIAALSPQEIWNNYIRLIGAGAVAMAGIITVAKSIPTMYHALKSNFQQLKHRVTAGESGINRTQTDLPITVLGIGILVVGFTIILAPKLIGFNTSLGVRVLAAGCVIVFTYLFATVSSRIVGMVGVSSNPTSGMTLVTLMGTSLLFLAFGWTNTLGMAAALTIGTIVCVGASIAGDISQDLKAGYILGATPRKQQISELVGVATAAFAVAGSVWLLAKAFGFESGDLTAPQAMLMKTVVEGIMGGNLAWDLVLTGAAFAIVAELLRIPSLPFAVGMYLPLSTMTPIYVGGIIRNLIDKSA